VRPERVGRRVRPARLQLDDGSCAVVEKVSSSASRLFPRPQPVATIARQERCAVRGEAVLGVEGERRPLVGRRVAIAVVTVARGLLVVRILGLRSTLEAVGLPPASSL